MAYEPNSPGTPSGASPGFNDKLSSAASEAKTRAADLGRKATDTAAQARSTAAGGLSTAAEALDERADSLPGGPGVATAAHRAADALAASADYVRDKNVRAMMNDAMDIVKRNPGVALAGAVALGFLVSRALSRK